MNKYRSGEKRVEAIQFKGNNFEEIKAFIGGDVRITDKRVVIETRDGQLSFSISEYILKDENECICVLNADIFKKRYKKIKKCIEKEKLYVK